MIRIVPSAIGSAAHRWYKRLETKEHPLLYLFLEITRRCNLSCKHCGSDCSSNESLAQLTTDSWVRIIDFIAASFTPRPAIILTGGEPLLHPDLEKILAAINVHSMRWGMVSNGYALDDDNLAMLIAHRITSFTVSLDGLEDNHNWLRGRPDAFSQAIAAMNRVARSRIPESDVVTCVHSRNLVELDKLAELFLSMGVRSWRLFRVFPSGRAKSDSTLSLDHDGMQAMIEWVECNKKALKRKGLSVNLSCEGWLPFAQDCKVRDAPFFCRAGTNIASILCDGTITGCSNNPAAFFEGNILRDNFATLWQNGFAKFRERKWIERSSCAKCRYVRDCRGGSIHLWQSSMEKPDFCYVPSVEKPGHCHPCTTHYPPPG